MLRPLLQKSYHFSNVYYNLLNQIHHMCLPMWAGMRIAITQRGNADHSIIQAMIVGI